MNGPEDVIGIRVQEKLCIQKSIINKSFFISFLRKCLKCKRGICMRLAYQNYLHETLYNNVWQYANLRNDTAMPIEQINGLEGN